MAQFPISGRYGPLLPSSTVARRPNHKLARRKPRRPPRDRVLIVCGGQKTEPEYFRNLAEDHRLSTAKVVVKESEFEPQRLVRHATSLRKAERKLGEDYERIYCVFDHDDQPRFEQASSQARTAGIHLARSWPCFEFWFLLHFHYTRSAFTQTGNMTACARCTQDLKAVWPDYDKTAVNYGMLRDRTESAKANAARALADVEITSAPNPSTEVHALVAYLQGLAQT